MAEDLSSICNNTLYHLLNPSTGKSGAAAPEKGTPPAANRLPPHP